MTGVRKGQRGCGTVCDLVHLARATGTHRCGGRAWAPPALQRFWAFHWSFLLHCWLRPCHKCHQSSRSPGLWGMICLCAWFCDRCVNHSTARQRALQTRAESRCHRPAGSSRGVSAEPRPSVMALGCLETKGSCNSFKRAAQQTQQHPWFCPEKCWAKQRVCEQRRPTTATRQKQTQFQGPKLLPGPARLWEE